jgi:hypothetical protein
MSDSWTIEEILSQLIRSGAIMEMATLQGDYKRNNKEGKITTRIFKYLEKNLDLANAVLPLLFTHENVVTRTDAASYCLALNIHVDEAVKVLEEVANDPNTRIFGFNAKMTLKVWRERGYLKIYQNQMIYSSTKENNG